MKMIYYSDMKQNRIMLYVSVTGYYISEVQTIVVKLPFGVSWMTASQ